MFPRVAFYLDFFSAFIPTLLSQSAAIKTQQKGNIIVSVSSTRHFLCVGENWKPGFEYDLCYKIA